MTLERKILEFKLDAIEKISFFYETLAKQFFNYPQNPGMLVKDPDAPNQTMADFVSRLPMHAKNVPAAPKPQNLLEAFVGNLPASSTIDKVFYEHKHDGYYNFYVENYRNIFFLPDWFSQWIQIQGDMAIDITRLEIFRESIFVGLLLFLTLLQFRIQLYWFLTINPYTRPWVYLISLTDWIFDVMAGFSPIIFGLDLTSAIISGLVGKFADGLNHLVFTMPFLPSEGQPGRLMIDGRMKDVILFRYLPSLWYSNPIPDDLREFWYTDRPEIFKFMKKNYGHLDIEFLPNRVLKEMYDKQHDPTIIANSLENIKNISSNVVCEGSAYINEMNHLVNQKQFILLNFLENSIDKISF
jgi:hypothetical protein